jgi:hypothetical protein
MTARQEFDDDGRFAVPPHPQHNAFIGPFHGGSLQDSDVFAGRISRKAHSAGLAA